MTGPLRVLVVDDLPDVADALVLLLELTGYDARAAHGGRAGLDAARAEVPDCIVTDIGMPGLDGYGLAAAVRADPTLAGVKLVAHSAYSDPDHVRRAGEAGFDFRLTKPADPVRLLELLRMMENIQRLAAATAELSQKNAELAAETKDLLQGVKEDIQEVKQEVRDLKAEVRALKADDPDRAD